MHVAHFVQRYPPALGGSEVYFARLSRYLAAKGDHVTVFTTTALDLDALWSSRGRCLKPGRQWLDGVEVRRHALLRLPWQRVWLKALSLVPHAGWRAWTLSCNPLAFGMLGIDEPFDVVHATAFPYAWPILCARRLARRLGVPFLLTPFLHLGDPGDPRDRTRRAFLQPPLLRLARSADRLFVQTEGERRALLDLGFAPERLVLQGMGVNVEECTGGDRARTRAEWGAAVEEAVVGHLANNSREKGTIDLLEAASRAWRGGARFHLVLAGPEMPNFRDFWSRYPDAGRVRRLGVLDDRQKRDFLAALDVFALPSRADSFGLVLLEAWANGAANVGYRAGGIPWVIRDEEDGLLVPCGDLDGLAAALRRLADDASLRRRLGAAGRERLGRDFRWEDKLDLVRRVYEDARADAAR
jgi:glycosyltransferase involved in cell wall biosynthesis